MLARFDLDLDRAGERLGNYAFLKTAEDVGESQYQRMHGRFMAAASRAAQAASFIRPEILAIAASKMKTFLDSPALAPYKLILERVLRYKPHTLGPGEEKLLAMQAEMAQAANQIFRQLNDADMKFGAIKNDRGQVVALSHASFSALLHVPDRALRRKGLFPSILSRVCRSRPYACRVAGRLDAGRHLLRQGEDHPSVATAAAGACLFPDQVPVTVYDNLIASVHRHLPALYRYYDVRRRKMRLKEIHQYDTYVPILAGLQRKRSWDEAVDVVLKSLVPLGSEYCGALEKGLRGRWCDRYENRGKQSGAFSSGTFDGEPYILMNFQPEVLDHVFTLAHEAGHSMHSWHSARHQPFAYYNYVIFVAEVASTFNEQLLSRYLLENARNDEERAFLINRQLDAMRGTIFRQTMFAEFEKLTHASCEAGEPASPWIDSRRLYRGLARSVLRPRFRDR